MIIKTIVLSASFALFAVGAAHAATITPSDYNTILTEGKRTATIDGAGVDGNAALDANGDIDVFNLGVLASETLLIGRVTNSGLDEYFSATVNGDVKVTLLNYGESSRGGQSPFGSVFEFLVNDVVTETTTLTGSTLFENINLGSFRALGNKIGVRITSTSGASDYDIGISVSPVPLPAAGLLLLVGIGGLAAIRRRKKA